jgi:DNA-binding transcriptional regulator YdaS (Cro superfamily)
MPTSPVLLALLADAVALLGGPPQAAQALGVNERSVRYWLSGAKTPQPGVWADLERALEDHALRCQQIKRLIRTARTHTSRTQPESPRHGPR